MVDGDPFQGPKTVRKANISVMADCHLALDRYGSEDTPMFGHLIDRQAELFAGNAVIMAELTAICDRNRDSRLLQNVRTKVERCRKRATRMFDVIVPITVFRLHKVLVIKEV